MDELERLKRWMWDVCTCQACRPSDQAEEGERSPLLPEPDGDPIQDQPSGPTMLRHPLLPDLQRPTEDSFIRGDDAGGPGEEPVPKPQPVLPQPQEDDEATPEPEAGPSQPQLTRRPAVILKRSSSLNEEDWSRRGPPGPPRERRGKPAPAITDGQQLLRGTWRRNLAVRTLPPQPPAGEAGPPPVLPEAQLQAKLAKERRRAERAVRHAARHREKERQALAEQDAQLTGREASLAVLEEGLVEEVAALGTYPVWPLEPPLAPGIRWRQSEEWLAGLRTLEEKENFKGWQTYLESWRQTLKTREEIFALRQENHETRQQQVAAENGRRAGEQGLFDDLDVDADDISSGSDLYNGIDGTDGDDADDDDRPGHRRSRRRAASPDPAAETQPEPPIVRGRRRERPDR